MLFYENVRWLQNRFRSMGPAEVISRLADVGRHAALRASLKSFQSRPCRGLDRTNRSHTLLEIRDRLDGVSAGARDAVIRAANGWLEHRATFFALQDVPLGNTIDWHRDYSSGLIAPIAYTSDINHRDRRKVGDIKYIWELNRLQHLVLLAVARLWTGNVKYWAEIEKQIASWNNSNPFMMGVNWKSPLEAGLRLISWAYVYFLASGCKQAVPDDLFGEAVYHHQYFIRKFYSKHSSANNHLIGEMAGLYVASVFWPWYRESASWRSFARQTLIEEIARQVEPDGVCCERATEYQMFVLELFLLAGALGQAVGDPFPQEYWDRVNRLIVFLSAISDSSGNLFIFGDGDGGQVIALPETIQERSRALIGIQQNHGKGICDLRSLLLLWGQAPEEIPIALPETPEKFTEGGYYILSTDRGTEDELMVVFDIGPLGLPALYAHGHADALSVWLSYGGHEFLIDPGTYCYEGMTEWRSYFRGTAAHNTVRIDGVDQSVAGGTFLWCQPARARVENIKDTEDYTEVTGSHDGYRRLSDPVTHTRALRLIKKLRTLIITDRLRCQRSHGIELFFHFSEKCQVWQAGAGLFEASNHNKRISIRLDPRLSPELQRGCEKPILGWVSRRFGVKEPTFTLVARGSVVGTTQFVTEIAAV